MITPPPPPPVQIDLVTLAVAAATLMFSPELAQIVGPYAVILFGATLGAAVSASGQPQTSRWATVRYMLWVVGVALIVTVPAATLIERYWAVEMRWTLCPVAALVGGIGRDWPAVARWMLGLVRSWVERKSGSAGGGKDGNE